ncbi:flavodoxin [Rhodopirellula baltica SH28]|jgi:NAD(P)H dehydrogenase (quinone)|uniref:Flavodoxin n=2 Tax=Rhodopirellula baltica TaxID=265606 RepID=K5DCG7_RHOBT|nr:flavodoxin family protein [Rhodopirellula baltica]EKK00519.1 flavodoxin [Rhodopirellula baltica SH28]ELP29853.1 flavodoxin/nitric oxide synthase [Rhodopirellula baltica SWK14]
MPKVLILYHSNTQNTHRMAELVAEGAGQLEGADVRLRNIDDADHTDLDWCDGIALGSPTNYGTLSWQMKRWWDEQPIENWGKRDGKIGCVFTSAGAWGGGQEWTCMALMSILINYGFLVFGLTDYTGIKFSAHYGAISAGGPDEERVQEACRRLGRRLSEWTANMIDGQKEAHPLNQTYERFKDLGK